MTTSETRRKKLANMQPQITTQGKPPNSNVVSGRSTKTARVQKTFHQDVHMFRGLAILLIIGAHTLPSFNWNQYPSFGKFIDILCNESSIYFFFIAGFLFLHLSSSFDIKKYYTQKLKTVILPYIIVSIPALIVFTLFIEREGVWNWFYDLSKWEQIGLFLVTGKHLAPLWFVPTIALFYLAAPVLVKMDRSWAWLYISIIPLLAVAIIYGRNGPYGPLDKVRYLAVAYMFGMFYYRYNSLLKSLARQFWWILLSAGCIGFYLCWITYGKTGSPDFHMLQKLAFAPLILLLLDNLKNVIGTKLDYIATVSFGIFFVHAYFISALKVGYTLFLTGEASGGSLAVALVGTPMSYAIYYFLVLATSLILIVTTKLYFGKNSRLLIGA